jgi:hypothetical protein
VAPAAQALGATLVAGSLVNLLPSVDGFRRNTPTLPPLTGLEGETTLAEKVADYINGARVQVGFPVPPPFLPPTVGLGLLATAYGLWDRLRDAAAQLWSLFNSKPEQPEEGVTTYRPLPGPVQSRTVIIEPNPLNSWTTGMGTTADTLKVRTPFVEELFGVPRFSWRGDLFRADGTTELDVCLSRAFAGTCNTHADGETSIRVVLGDVSEGIEQEPDVAFQPAQPLPPPPVLRDLDPQLAPLPPLPLVSPSPAPAPTGDPSRDPQPAPSPQPAPQPAGPGPGVAPAPPATLPTTPVFPEPPPTVQPTPPGQPTAPDGSLVPLPLPLPTTTSPESHVINGTEVPANGPAPTLTGIAQELGRLERKSAQLLDPGRAPTGPNLDRLGLLDELIRPLVEAILQQFASGAYELSSPCELNEAGERVPVVVPFGPGLSAIGTLHNKVDALAELLQASKDLKQPICRPKAPIGEPVTVNFEQVS